MDAADAIIRKEDCAVALSIDVIIPTYHPDEKYVRLLEMLARQEYPVNQIIVLNTEEPYYQKDQYPVLDNMTVTHITKREFDHGGTRNQGVRMSESDIVLLMTQDAVPADEALTKHIVECFSDEKVASVYARQLPAEDCNIIERYTRQFNYPEESFVKSAADKERLGIKTYFCSDVCAAYRRKVYEELGGFPLHTIFNEDMIYASSVIGAGYSIAYCAEAQVVHSHNYTGRQQFHRNFDNGVAQCDYKEIFESLPAEGEGIRMVKSTAKFLVKQGKWYLLPKLAYVSGCKYVGFFLGKRYKKLPEALVKICTMDKGYWKKRQQIV